MLLSAHFLFWEILNLTLTFDVYVKFNLSSNANLTTFHPTLDWPHCDWKSQASRVIPGILVIPFIPITLVIPVVLYPSHSSNPCRPNRPYHLVLSIWLCFCLSPDQLHGYGSVKCSQFVVCSWSPSKEIYGMCSFVFTCLLIILCTICQV